MNTTSAAIAKPCFTLRLIYLARVLLTGFAFLICLSQYAKAQREQTPQEFNVAPLNLKLKPGMGQGKIRLDDDAKRRLEATIVRIGLAVSFSNIICAEMTSEACVEMTNSMNTAHHPVRASLNLNSWAESAKEIDRAVAEFTSEEAKRLARKKSAILIRLAIGKIQEEIDLNPASVVPESIRSLASTSGLRKIEIHYNVLLFEDRIALSSIAVDRTAPDFKLHRPILTLPPIEITLNAEHSDLGQAVKWAAQQAIEEFGRQLPARLK